MATGIRELKRVLGGMRARIDEVFTAAEKRKLLKDIATGRLTNANELRAYVGRVEQIKKKRTQEATASLAGKIVDAGDRKPLGGVDITIQQTNFSEKTDNSGNFIWEKMVKGRTHRIQCSLGGYKPNMTDYQATMEEEQHVVIKLVAIQGGPQSKRDDKKKGGPGGH